MSVDEPDPEDRTDPATTASGTALPRLVGLFAIFGLLLVFGFLAVAAKGRLFRQERSGRRGGKNNTEQPLKSGHD